MSQGKKYGEAIRERAIAMVMSGKTISDTAREMKLAYTTVYAWIKTLQEEPNFEELREIKRQQFITNAWNCVMKAQNLLQRKLDRATDEEAAIDTLIEIVNSDAELDGIERRSLINKLSAIRLDDAGKLATVIGTMYDKQALASNQPTSIHGGEVGIKRFEEL